MSIIRGIMATTHLDKHNERLTRSALENMSRDINESAQILWITMNHQSTLPPIGIVEKSWVEQMPDGEFALYFEGNLFENDKSYIFAHDYEIEPDEINRIEMKLVSLGLSHDPRNFSNKDIKEVIEDLSKDVPVEHRLFVRKSEIPQSVIWVIVAFVGVEIAGGFLNRIGEIAADKVIEVTKPLLHNLGKKLSLLNEKTIPGDKPDYIIKLQIPNVDENIEGAIESPSREIVSQACEKLPELYAYCLKVLSQNQPGYFQDIKFLYNHITHCWEVNYFTIKKSKRIVLGRRYIDSNHPLRLRYEQEIDRMNDSGKREDR